MLNANFWNESVPRAELDQRARDARLRLAQVERMLAARVAAKNSWVRRAICLFGFGKFGYGSRGNQTRGPLSNRRPSRMAKIPHAWFEPWGPASHA